jgi:ElaB/YqjD/DUF883 family membrane-anchored ribosome-binding protein
MVDLNKSPDQLADDAKQVGHDAMNKAESVASDSKQVAKDAVATGRAYATGAVNAAGKKIDSMKSQLHQTTDYVTKAINDEPVKAVLITAVVSSLITALLVSTMRSDGRYY